MSDPETTAAANGGATDDRPEAGVAVQPGNGRRPRDPDARVVLSAKGLSRSYRAGPQRLQVLQDVDLELTAGEAVAIMGRSGAGKSTLLNLLGLLDRPDEGSLTIAGTETVRLGSAARAALRNAEIGFVFQFYHLISELTALENALLPRMIEAGPLRWMGERKEARAQAKALLDEMGLGARMKHRPSELSGGERQRVAIARALVARPSLLLCDEPTGNLDERTSDTITELLFELNVKHDVTLVLVTHDPMLGERADRCLHLHSGSLHADAETGS